MVIHHGSSLSPLLFVVVMQEAIREARGKGLLDLLYANDLVTTAESEKEAVRKFGAWKREMETKVNINKTKLMVMLGHKGEGTHVGFVAKELEQTQYGVSVVKGDSASRDVWGSEI